MSQFTRRAMILGGAAAGLSACGNGIGSNNAAKIDARVERTLAQMYAQYPSSTTLVQKSTGMLVMPLMTEAGFGIGGGYGRGALMIDNAIVDYYSAAKANIGLQIGAQQYAHILFFMTDDALSAFRASRGWAAGAEVEYAFRDSGQTFKSDTIVTTAPVIAAVFGQAGLLVGATLEGVKYTRIIP